MRHLLSLIPLFPLLLCAALPCASEHSATGRRGCFDEAAKAKPPVTAIPDVPREHNSVTGGVTSVLAGHVAHGMEDVEVLLTTLKPGESSSIHSHPQEEVLVTLRGVGTISVLGEEGGSGRTRRDHVLGHNSTATLKAGTVHQVHNSGNEDLEILMTLADPPVKIVEYPSWEEATQHFLGDHKPSTDSIDGAAAPWDKCFMETKNEGKKDEL